MGKWVCLAIAYVSCGILLIVVSLVLSTVLPDSQIADRVTLISGFITFFALATTLGREGYARWKKRGRRGRTSPKWDSFGAYAALMVTGSVIMVCSIALASHSFAIARERRVTDIDPMIFVSFNVLVTLFMIAFLAALTLKTLGTRMLDQQKLHLREMVRARNEMPAESMERLRSTDRCEPSINDLDTYRMLLYKICKNSLKAASEAGLQLRRARRGRIALLFLARPERRDFFPFVMVGGSTDYFEALSKNPLKYFDADRFVDHYNAFRGRRRDALDQGREPPDLDVFRRETRDMTSSPGLVYALEKRLAFDRPFERCLTSSFDFLSSIPEHERHHYEFKQMIGIPIFSSGRKVGVLLLTSRTRHSFHTSDRIYWVIGDVLGSALELGVSLGMFRTHGVESLCAMPGTENPDRLVELINQLQHDFGVPANR